MSAASALERYAALVEAMGRAVEEPSDVVFVHTVACDLVAASNDVIVMTVKAVSEAEMAHGEEEASDVVQ